MTRLTQRRAALVCIGIGVCLLSLDLLAQQAVIDRCKATLSDADRIACLEAALLGREVVVDQLPKAPVDSPTEDVDSGPGAAAPSTPTVVATAPADEAPLSRAPETSAEPSAAPVGIGAEQVIARNQTPKDVIEALEEERGLKVASYDIVPYERLLIRLENGQVWRQSRGDNQKIRVDLRRNQTVDISESSFGGYKLRLNELRRIIRAERVK